MEVCLRGVPPGYGVTLQEILWLFFPDVQICETSCSSPAATLHFTYDKHPGGTMVVTAFFSRGEKEGRGEAWLSQFCHDEEENVRRRLTKLALLRALEDFTGKSAGSWGILTGVRPTKIVHRQMDKGVPEQVIYDELVQRYAVRPEKADLLIDVAARQRPFFLSFDQDGDKVGVYIGIPFCPTRCLYCSFPGYELKRYGAWMPPFLSALRQEIEVVGAAIRNAGQKVQNIYIGGGTPTALSAAQLANLLSSVEKNLCCSSTIEFTVEGGRPDTLDRRKMEIMLHHGVNRLSVNPQSMNDETLECIGRCHRAADVISSVELARDLGFPVINMDLIVGLPGESAYSVERTLNRIAWLKPENLTVHTMAIKRASRLTAEKEQWVLPTEDEVADMLEITQEGARHFGMVPYYLYRQKRILANLENVGYSIPGHECIYNIQVMEERQTIWGLGAGAATKVVDLRDGSLLDTWHNSKDPKNYVERLEEIVRRKLNKLEGITC